MLFQKCSKKQSWSIWKMKTVCLMQLRGRWLWIPPIWRNLNPYGGIWMQDLHKRRYLAILRNRDLYRRWTKNDACEKQWCFMAISTSSSSQSEQVSTLCLTLSACWWWGCCDVGVKQLWALNISLHVSLCAWAPAYFWESVLPRYSESTRLTFF